MIRAPLRARVSAMERPMPCAAPVTSATCPWRSTCMAFPFGHPGFALGYAVNLLYQPRGPELSRDRGDATSRVESRPSDRKVDLHGVSLRAPRLCTGLCRQLVISASRP